MKRETNKKVKTKKEKKRKKKKKRKTRHELKKNNTKQKNNEKEKDKPTKINGIETKIHENQRKKIDNKVTDFSSFFFPLFFSPYEAMHVVLVLTIFLSTYDLLYFLLFPLPFPPFSPLHTLTYLPFSLFST